SCGGGAEPRVPSSLLRAAGLRDVPLAGHLDTPIGRRGRGSRRHYGPADQHGGRPLHFHSSSPGSRGRGRGRLISPHCASYRVIVSLNVRIRSNASVGGIRTRETTLAGITTGDCGSSSSPPSSYSATRRSLHRG